MPKYNISDYNEEGNGTIHLPGDDNLRETKMKNRQQLYLHLDLITSTNVFLVISFHLNKELFAYLYFFFFYITFSQNPLSKYVIFSLATFEKELFL